MDIPGAFGVPSHLQPFRVPVSMHQDNRARLVARFSADNPSAVEGAGSILLFKGLISTTANYHHHPHVPPRTLVVTRPFAQVARSKLVTRLIMRLGLNSNIVLVCDVVIAV